jgi:DNA polymerase-3 subunit epsilon
VGYYVAFDVAMLNREVWRLLGVRLPQRRIEVSALYYELKNRRLPPLQRGNVPIDLRFATLMADLGLPMREAHDALNDAVMAGLAFIKLRQLLGE